MATLRISSFIAVCFVFAAVKQAEGGVHHVLQKCADKEGASLADVQVFMTTGEATQSLKCGFKCVMQEISVLNDDGTMKVDVMVAFNPAEKADLVRKCSNLPPGDLCENAYLHYKCALDNDPEYIKSVTERLLNDF